MARADINDANLPADLVDRIAEAKAEGELLHAKLTGIEDEALTAFAASRDPATKTAYEDIKSARASAGGVVFSLRDFRAATAAT